MSAPAEAKTLLEFLLDLLTDDDAREAFQENPREALDHAGLGDVTLHEIKELLPVVLDHCSPEKCADYEDECDEYEGPCPPAHCPPELSDCDDRPSDDHDVECAKVITHLNYVTNNYSFDSHDTIFNNETNIWNLGDGDVNVDQDFDFSKVDVDHGGTYVGGDNNAPITHGDGNVVGDGNQVAGQNSHAAFGAGSVYDHIGTGDGGAINFGSGSASGSNVDDHSNTEVNGENNNVGSGAQANTDASHSGNTVTEDSGNTDVDIRDSGNDNSHHEDNSDNSTHSHVDNSDSGNVDNSHQDNSGFHFPDVQ